MALAVPAAGGVQRAFGTDAKSLQVGFAVEAGIRAARLAAAGAQADPSALDVWLGLVGGDPSAVDLSVLQCRTGWRSSSTRAATRCSGRSARCPGFPPTRRRSPDRAAHPGGDGGAADPPPAGRRAAGQVQPGVRGGGRAARRVRGFGSFTDEAVRRDEARRLVNVVETKLDPGGDWLLDGELEAEVHTADGAVLRTRQQYPPGSPARPPTRGPAGGQAGRLRRGLMTTTRAVDLG